MRRTFCSLVGLQLPKLVPSVRGTPDTKNWRVFLMSEQQNTQSAWHDLPLSPEGAEANIFTFVNEIPRGVRAKYELSKEEEHNPIMQDIHKKEPGMPLRYFTYGDLPFNYGFIPRTWEDPNLVDADTKCSGDGDPIDVVQLSMTPSQPGEYHAVRVLGVLGLIDQGETDWKILVEPATADGGFRDLRAVPAELKDRVVDWFRNYKTTDGKKQNEFVFNGEIRGADEAIRIIHECSAQYKQLISGKAGKHKYWLK